MCIWIFVGDASRCQMKFDDPRVCKSFLLSCCPHDILSSTVSDFFYKLSSKDTLPASKLSSCLFVYIMFKSKASVIVNIICVQTNQTALWKEEIANLKKELSMFSPIWVNYKTKESGLWLKLGLNSFTQQRRNIFS